MAAKETTIKLSDISAFLYRSKRKAFANTDNKTSLTNETSIYSNRELPWCYTDTYWGNTVERGTEDVSYNLTPVWSMQYRGGFHKPYWRDAESLAVILKKALMKLPKEFPIRGPVKFQLSEFFLDGKRIEAEVIYTNKWEGTLARFKGEEKIVIDGSEVFYHDYMGGFNRNKHFPVLVD